jgi:hypothetical protein
MHQSFFLVEVRLELTQLLVRKTGELKRVCAHGGRVTSIGATGEDGRENHASRWNTDDLEAARAARSEAELSAIERLAAHVVIILRNRVEWVHLAALVDAAAGNDTTKDTAFLLPLYFLVYVSSYSLDPYPRIVCYSRLRSLTGTYIGLIYKTLIEERGIRLFNSNAIMKTELGTTYPSFYYAKCMLLNVI